MAIREDLLLRIVDLVFEAGAALAIPSRVLYLSEAEGQELPNPDTQPRDRAA